MLNLQRNKYIINNEKLFFINYALVLIRYLLLEASNLDGLLSSRVVSVLSALCFLMIIINCLLSFVFMRSFTRKELLVSILLLSIFLLSYYKSKNTIMVINLMILLCSKDIDFDKLCRFGFRSILTIILFVGALAILGFISIGTRMRTGLDQTRYAMGFSHPNQFGILSFQLIAMYLYLNRAEKQYTKFLIAFIISVITFLITKSNTPIIVTTFMIGSMMVLQWATTNLKYSKTKSKLLVRFALFLAIIIALFIVYQIWKNPYILNSSVKTLRSRFLLAQKYVNAYGIHLFGSKILIGTNVALPGYAVGYSYLDNGYIRVLVEHGLIVSIVLLMTVILYSVTLIKTEKWELLIITICICIYFFSEHKISYICNDIFLVDIGINEYNAARKHLKHKVM